MWLGDRDTIRIKGVEITKDENKILIDENVGRDKFVPHQINFYKTLIQKI